MLELVDRSDLKSDVRFGRVGSTPTIDKGLCVYVIASIAQLVERLTENEEVVDSSST